MMLNNDLLHIIGDIFKFWLMGGCKESPEELADMFLNFM